ncbi:tetratricopeptide repeat protein [Polyangium spumosum]|uniref:Uncharacterized protein n=1 Tax=Polyangium spumosum TaxID=889282 RepID=A0A6N7QBC7_9BACT|nr:hypothetical protein [Polyangium spumosum]MRG98161.1 hypothetical protein [Polyangium spumosum]
MYEQALEEMTRKDYAAACPRLEEVIKLAPEGVGGMITLGQCYEGWGRLATAHAAYRRAEQVAAAKGDKDRQQKAAQKAGAIEPHLSQVTVVVPDALRDLAGLSVQRDGAVVEQAQWGVPVPVDVGKHVVAATATGRKPWEKHISVMRDGDTVVVEIEAPAPAAVSTPPVQPPTLPTALSPMATTQASQRPGLSGAEIGALVLGVGGLLTLGVGSGFGIVAMSKQDQSNEGLCNSSNQCEPMGLQLREEGIAAGNVATALFIAGGAALTGSIVLFAIRPSKNTRMNVGSGGIWVNGSF